MVSSLSLHLLCVPTIYPLHVGLLNYLIFCLRFPNLGILHVTKKKVPEVLTQRLIKQMMIREKSLDHLEMQPDIQPSVWGLEGGRRRGRIGGGGGGKLEGGGFEMRSEEGEDRGWR